MHTECIPERTTTWRDLDNTLYLPKPTTSFHWHSGTPAKWRTGECIITALFPSIPLAMVPLSIRNCGCDVSVDLY